MFSYMKEIIHYYILREQTVTRNQAACIQILELYMYCSRFFGKHQVGDGTSVSRECLFPHSTLGQTQSLCRNIHPTRPVAFSCCLMLNPLLLLVYGDSTDETFRNIISSNVFMYVCLPVTGLFCDVFSSQPV
jgi:hypothetical protein